MNALAPLVVLLSAAPSAVAFRAPQPSARAHPSSLRNTLRDMASYPDDKMMSEFGQYSRSPRGGMEGRRDGGMPARGGPGGPGGMGGGGWGPERMYTRDGFDPYSAYGGGSFMSRGDGPDGPRGYHGGPMNRVKPDNTMGGFDYSSRNREYGYGDGPSGVGGLMGDGMGGPPYGFDEMMMMEYEQGPPPPGMMMDYDQGYMYGGFEDDMGDMNDMDMGNMGRLGP